MRQKTALMYMSLSVILFVLLGFASKGLGDQISDSKEFKNYWYKGVAEISRFKLEQARYGEIHTGNAVLIFVTEDFLKKQQVKSEHQVKPNDAISVLKLNRVKKFNTGIYPYSVMSSIFTPVKYQSYPRTLKTTTSVQEWCGHTYTQLNLKKDRYRVKQYSYFMNEGDKEFNLKPVILEEEIWTKIRLAPNSLPIGDIEMIPGSPFIRFAHKELMVEKASATLIKGKDLNTYIIEYQDFHRKLVISFKKTFPHEIMEWEETSARKGRKSGQVLKTRAIRTHILLTDYWSKNSPEDGHYRAMLGLE